MSLIHLIIFVVVTVGLQQANSQGTGYPNRNNNQQAYQNPRNNHQESQGGTYQNPRNNHQESQGGTYQNPRNNHQQNNRNHCQMAQTKFQCIPGSGQRIYNSGNVWDPSRAQYIGVEENWDCKPCCQLGGKTIQECDQNMGQILKVVIIIDNTQQVNQERRYSYNQQEIQRGRTQIQNRNQWGIHGRSQNRNNNQQRRNSNHCPMRQTSHQCTLGPGRRIYNSGRVWDPSKEEDVGVDEKFNCKPCCRLSSKSIAQCDEDIGQIRRMKRGLEEGKEESKLEENHCLMIHVRHQCSPGPGQRIYNSGAAWDPSQEQYGGVDEIWNCTACCQSPGKTIPQCDADVGQDINEEKEESEYESTELPITTISVENPTFENQEEKHVESMGEE